MATIIVYLDKRGKEADAPCPVKLAVNNHGKTALISLGISVPASQWDDRRKAVVGHPSRQTYNAIITARLATAQHELLRLEENGQGRGLTIAALRDHIRAAVMPDSDKPKQGTFYVRLLKCLEEHSGNTLQNYKTMQSAVRAFDANAEFLSFEDVGRDWLMRFISFLKNERGLKANSINAILVRVGAVFNAAIDAGETSLYPLRRLKLKAEPTAKRSLGIDALRFWMVEAVPASKGLRLGVVAFRLSFMLIGINMADLYGLTIVDGRARYARSKTKRLYSIRVEPEAEPLLDEFRELSKGSVEHTDRLKAVYNLTQRVNYGLINMAQKEGLPPITSYWARHSWATIAASLDIPKDTIAAALGHGGNTVTDVYIDFDMRKVDEANRRVLDWVLYEKK